jgi:pilus assembly protein CpaF
MNALLSVVPQHERVVLVEETPELRPACEHVVSLTSRVSNVEGKGHVGLDELLRAALRMRPDRIVVGEVRGAEALVALGAMSTGHEGSLVTFHARSASDASTRFVELALQEPLAPSRDAVRAHVERAFDLFVHVARDGGRRRVVAITERDAR